jgi:hypothetical protein
MVILDDSGETVTTEELTPKETTRELRRVSIAIDKITKHLFGNGEPGQDELIRNTSNAINRLETNFDEYKKSQDEAKKARDKAREENKTWMKRTAIITAIPYTISFVVWIIYWATKLQPLLEELEKVSK